MSDPGGRLPAANGTDQRLDELIDEIKGLRADLAAARPSPTDGEIELREPLPIGRPKKRGEQA